MKRKEHKADIQIGSYVVGDLDNCHDTLASVQLCNSSVRVETRSAICTGFTVT